MLTASGAIPGPQAPRSIRRAVTWSFGTWMGRAVLATLATVGAMLAVIRATTVAVLPVRTQRDVSGTVATATSFPRLLELHTGLRMEGGNDLTLLLNGDGTYPRLWQDLRSARQSIAIQSYYSQPGAMTDTLSAILKGRARAGVSVRVLLDAFGSAQMPESWLEELRNAGVTVARLRPLRWHTIHGGADRSHVRAVVVDGRIGYTGGFGFADYWLGQGTRAAEWRESNVRVEGPVVAQLQAAFSAGWLEATGELLTATAIFPPPGPRAASARGRAGVLLTTTSSGSTAAERFVLLALLGARHRLYLSNSYFVPPPEIRRLLIAAAARGVDVRILTAGASTDVATTRYAGRHAYEPLLRNGIRIFEYAPSMMHAKTFTIDGVWSSVGSMNFDQRSMAFNDELTLVIHDTAVTGALDRAFQRDLRYSREVLLSDFARRSWRERVLEFAASVLAGVL